MSLIRAWRFPGILIALVAGCLLALNACGESEKKAAPEKKAQKASDGDKKSKKDSEKSQTEKRTKKTPSSARTGKRKTAIKSIEERRKARAKSLAERRAKLKKRREARRKGRTSQPAARPKSTSAPQAPATASMGPRVGMRPTAPRARPVASYLRVEHYITLSEAREMTTKKRLSQLGPLVGVKPTDRYNSVYYAPPKRSRFGVAVQVWKERTIGGVNERFTRMKRDYPNVEASREVSKGSDREFFSNWENIISVTFAAMKKRTLITVSCGTKTCSLKQLYALARAAYGRL